MRPAPTPTRWRWGTRSLLWTVTVALALLVAVPVVAEAAPVELSVRFGEGARLGGDTSMSIRIHVASGLPPVTEFRVLTPPGMTFTSSDLGLASCDRPMVEIQEVRGPLNPNPCPANSLMATGLATAGLRLSRNETIYGAGFVGLHAGGTVQDKPGLVAIVDTYNPVRMQLTYAGYLYVPPENFGIGLAMFVPQIPKRLFDSPLALSTLFLDVGGPAITYYRRVRGRSVAYHPAGVPVPETCPRGGFRFRAIMRFRDAPGDEDDRPARSERHAVDAVVPCPPRRSDR